jgi:ABC-type amino acid transport substrate-binding protein
MFGHRTWKIGALALAGIILLLQPAAARSLQEILASKKIVLGSSGHEYAKEHFHKATIKALDTGDLTAGALDVLAGRSNAAIQDSFKIAQVVNMHRDQLVNLFEKNPFHLVFVSYAVSKNNAALLQLINTSLDWMESTGKWQELARPSGDQLAGVYFTKPTYKPFGGPAAKD